MKQKSKWKSLLPIFLSLTLLTFLVAPRAHAAPMTPDVSIDLASPGGGAGYTVAGLTITLDGSSGVSVYRLHGSTTSYWVEVSANVTVILDGADITRASGSAFAIVGGSDVLLELDGASSLQSGMNEPGLQVGAGQGLTIQDGDGSGGSLSANGSQMGAGIGGGFGSTGGQISILSGTVAATGGQYGAGIGGGFGGTGGQIEILGGTITANGGENAAGIGGGSMGSGGQISILGGMVTARGGNSGAGIGGGAETNSGTIHIGSEAQVTARGGHGITSSGSIGSGGGAGIGGGGTSTVGGHANDIFIADGAQITATGGNGSSAAAVGAPHWNPSESGYGGGGAAIGGGGGTVQAPGPAHAGGTAAAATINLPANTSSWTLSPGQGGTNSAGDQMGGHGAAGGDGGDAYIGIATIPNPMPGDGAAVIPSQTNTRLAMPTASVDYGAAALTGLNPGAAYTVDGAAYTADASGQVPLDPSWYGQTIAIVAVGNGVSTVDSPPQSLAVGPAPPPPPIPTPTPSPSPVPSPKPGETLPSTGDAPAKAAERKGYLAPIPVGYSLSATPAIQDVKAEALEGRKILLSVEATSPGGRLLYQWQVQGADGAWKNVGGANGSVYTALKLKAGKEYTFRCLVKTYASPSATSESVSATAVK